MQIPRLHPHFRKARRVMEILEDLLRSRVRFSAYKVGRKDLQRYLQYMKDSRPVFIYGFSSPIYLLALQALETGTRIDSLRLVVLTSEVVTERIRDAVSLGFRTNVVEEYGAAECPIIAYEDVQHQLRVREDLVMVETLPTQDNYYDVHMRRSG